MDLTLSQVESFARNGFLILERVLDPGHCDQAIAHCWQRLPSHFARDRPRTWRGPVQDSCFSLDVRARGGLVKFQKGIRGQPFLDDLLPTSVIGDVARQLLHDSVVMRPLLRGLYLVLPVPKLFSFPQRGHIEVHPFQLGTIAYLDDVAEDGGAFSVWPGSHLEMYRAFDSKLGFVANRRYDELTRRYNRLDPVKISARKGDVIVFHHRLFHAPSYNHCGKIRFALLCDYRTTTYAERCHERPAHVWEDWAGLRSRLGDSLSLDVPQRKLRSPLLRRIWVGSPRLRSWIFSRLLNDEAKARAGRSRDARAQQTVEDWMDQAL